MSYRKKPVVVEAWQWDGELLEDYENVPEWLLTAEANGDVDVNSDCYIMDKLIMEKSYMEIETLEGTHIARPGDYIIRGINGELYPCKPDIFLQTYEAVEGEQE